MIRRLIVTVGLAGLVFVSATGLTIRYVSTIGNDTTGNGTSGNPWRTIQYAITHSSVADTINVSSGTYTENITIAKALTILGADTTVTITPTSGTGITINSPGNNVTLRNIQVKKAQGNGINASNVSNLTLTNVYCIRDTVIGVQLTNINVVTVTGGSYSFNGKHGFNTAGGSNYTMSNVVADSNGWGPNMNGSGINLVGVTGTSQVTNLTVRYNMIHGLVIGDGSAGITVNGGTFRKNGRDRGFNGGGILVYAEVAPDSNITIQGTVLADSNITAGIWLNAPNSSYNIKNVLIGQSGTSTIRYNGGAGVIVYGNNNLTTVTGNFTKGSAVSAAGVLVTGISTLAELSPTNVNINNCTFNAGYDSLHPAITLDDGAFHISNKPVVAVGNTFAGAVTLSQVERVIHDSLDNNQLGRIRHSNDKPLPVEMVTFYTQVSGNDVTLVWSTATEVNNYGFDIERCQIRNGEFGMRNWVDLGIVYGSGTSASPHSYSFIDHAIPDGQYVYRLKQIDRDGTLSYSGEMSVEIRSRTDKFELGQNYPNPANPSTKIVFTVPVPAIATLALYDLTGRRVALLFEGQVLAGERNEVSFSTGELASGIYFYRLESAGATLVRKMLILK